MRRPLIWLVVFATVVVLVWLVRPQLLYPLLPSGHAVPVTHKQDHLTITGEYPAFGRPNVDASIRDLIDDTVVQPAIETVTTHSHESGTEDVLTVSYEVPYRTFRYRGVVLHVAVNAHDFQGEFVIVRTYDLWHDRMVGLDDIATPQRDPASAAHEAIVTHLEAWEDANPILLSRLEPRRDMLENLIVRSDGLEFFFNPGHIAPRERGVFTVFVPWDEATDLQKP